MTTPVASQTHPSHTPAVSGLSLSPECPQVWTKDVDNIGDNAYRRVRFERSAHLSPSVDHLWTGWREPLLGDNRTCGRNRSHWGRTSGVLSLSPAHRPPSTLAPTANPQLNIPRPRGNFLLCTESTSPMTTTTFFHPSITTQRSWTPPWICPLIFVNYRLSWASFVERTDRHVRRGVDE